MTFDQIADFVRKTYPTAVAVSFHINAHEMEMTVKTYDGLGDHSMKTLNGEWAEPSVSNASSDEAGQDG
jgi:hypothetical protein